MPVCKCSNYRNSKGKRKFAYTYYGSVFISSILESFQASNVRLRHSQNEVKTSLAVIYVNTLHKTRGLRSTKYSSKNASKFAICYV